MTDTPEEARIRRALQTTSATVESATIVMPNSDKTQLRAPHRPTRRAVVTTAAVALVLVVGLVAALRLGRSDSKAAAEPGWNPRSGTCTPSEPDHPGSFYGAGPLAVVLPADQAGPIPAIPYEGGYYFKLGWRRDVAGPLTIDLERLDGAGTSYAEIPDGYPETGMQASGIVVSAPGCWRITGHLNDVALSFVSNVGIDDPGN